ncbi:MAG TPA: type III-A CRISPR-associated protein Cas10/Csm1 [Lachnospiraceae bacterium]|nr:type III-A CRISPR-associated protein Cas10/Csm1 [Lachnospiraceae bacterium]
MTDRQLELTLGGMLHDIGKVLYREGGDGSTHSQIGYRFLKEELNVDNKEILDCVRYHHGAALKNADIKDDSLAYIVYFADNVAASIDRRAKDEEEKGFEIHTPTQPVFNLLNGNKSNMYYSPYCFNVEDRINYPMGEKKEFTREQYAVINDNIKDNLKNISLTKEYVNSLLEVMEANLSFVPSSTSKKEVPDISLFDHVKITSALSSCILDYISDRGDTNYKELLVKDSESFYDEKVYLLASFDFSGIQNFIYTIPSKNALRNLRARSFYLEIMMEHIIDGLLEELGLSRTNILYSGGGHCYLILPNTDGVKEIFDNYLDRINNWLLEQFDIELYLAGGYEECSANDLKNNPEGSYEDIFKNVSKIISRKKLDRYSYKKVVELNNRRHDDYSRECQVCKRIDVLNEEGKCRVCASLENFSSKVLYSDFFSVVEETENNLPLPVNNGLDWDTDDSLKEKIKNNYSFIRAYSKNKAYTGKDVATKIWVGDYTTKATFEEFSSSSKGVKRLGILRADVDNLGRAFVSGFKNTDNNDRYVTLSRTATLSRQLSLFFKLHINKILNEPSFTFDGEKKERRNATIVYSGGDDVFVVGSWNEIIEFAIDLHEYFKRFSENTLTISAGIGIYDDGYPISVSSREVEKLVDESKKLDGKDGITLMPDGCRHIVMVDGKEEKVSDGTYKWDEFIGTVLGEKFSLISRYMSNNKTEHGNALLYKLLELIRGQGDNINFARFIYTLSRLEPEKDATKELKELFKEFSQSMINWAKNERDCRHLKTAIELYVYLNRKREGEDE